MTEIHSHTTASTSQQPERISPAATPDEAIARQRQMALEDSDMNYEFAVRGYPIKVVADTFGKSSAASNLVRRRDARDNRLLRKLDSAVGRIARQIRKLGNSRALLETKLTRRLRNHRLRVFAADFAPKRRYRVACVAECLICCNVRPVTIPECCRTTESQNYVCLPCLTENAYDKSRSGTVNSATCPFCRTQFEVYRKRSLLAKPSVVTATAERPAQTQTQ